MLFVLFFHVLLSADIFQNNIFLKFFQQRYWRAQSRAEVQCRLMSETFIN